MTDFSSVTDFCVRFSDHPHFPEASAEMNSLYSTSLADPSAFFVDPTSWTDVLADNDLMNLIRHVIIHEVITPVAIGNTTLPNNIRVAVTSAPISVCVTSTITSNRKQDDRRLTSSNMVYFLRNALSTKVPSITFLVSISHLHFDLSTGPMDYRNWDRISTTPFASSARPAAPVGPSVGGITPADLQAAVANLSANLSSGIAAAVTTGVNTHATNLTAQFAALAGPSRPATAPSTSTSSSLRIFNHNALPSDVKARYLARIDERPTLGVTVRTHYSTGFLYHLELPDKIILADGSIFFIQGDPNEKEFMRASLPCLDDSHAGVRAWYDKLARCAMDYGFYVHPLWCFRSDHGGERGFYYGNDQDDDLPSLMDVHILRMSQPLYRFLSRKDMFPKDSRLLAAVSSSNGCGYRALKNILFPSHPAFHDQPSIMIKSYPRQKSTDDLLRYVQLFRDFLQLRAYITDNPATLDDPTEVDIFINNLTYSTYVNRATCDERRLSSFKTKYRGSQLIETIQKKLMAPDSPSLAAARLPAAAAAAPAARAFNNRRPPFVPRAAPIQQLIVAPTDDFAVDEYPALDHSSGPTSLDFDPAPPDDSPVETASSSGHSPALASLFSIQAPATSSDRALYHRYCASVYRIHADPDADRLACLVCGATHRFDSCPVLANVDFLKSHYIRYCQQLRRDSAARSTAFPSAPSVPAAAPPSRRAVNPIYAAADAAPLSSHPPYDSDSDSDDQDFQRGRA